MEAYLLSKMVQNYAFHEIKRYKIDDFQHYISFLLCKCVCFVSVLIWNIIHVPFE